MTDAGVARLLAEMAGAYMARQPEGAHQAWLNALRCVTDGAAMEALRAHIRKEPRPPRPADILRHIEASSDAVPEFAIDERLRRLSDRECHRIRERLARGDEQELRFQRFMLKKHIVTGCLTDEIRAYFNRVLGPEAVAETQAYLQEPE